MKILWLEQMLKEGSISEKAKHAIYADCASLVKVAITKDEAGELAALKASAWMDKHKSGITMATVGVAGVIASFFKDKFQNSKELSITRGDIERTRTSLLMSPGFSEHKDLAGARFNELIKIAPSVARNPELAKRILLEKIHSGFTSQDVQQLAQVQSAYTSNMSGQMQLSNAIKTASAKRTGETLASVITLCKEAGIRGKTLGRAVENALVMSSIPILGGLGVGAVQHIIGRNDKKKMEAALTSSFETAVRNSDPDRDGLHSNKEKARQAFQILAHFSPHVALQPEAARSFMSKMIHYDSTGRGAVQVEDIKSLSEIERNHGNGHRGSGFFDGLASGSQAFGLDNAMRSGVQGLGGALNSEVDMMARADLGLPRHKRGED